MRYRYSDLTKPLFTVIPKSYWKGWVSPVYPPHASFELYLVTRGAGRFLCHGRSLAVRAGSLVLLAPDMEHAWKTDHRTGLEYQVLSTKEWDAARLDRILEGQACRALRLSGEILRTYQDLYEKLLFEQEYSDLHSIAMARGLLQSIGALLERGLDRGGSRWVSFGEPVRRAREFLRSRCRENPTVAETARAAGISATHLRDLFRRETGMSPRSFLLSQKLEAAKDLLLSGETPLKTVAERVGFSSIHSFTSFFSARAGTPPAAWKRKMKER